MAEDDNAQATVELVMLLPVVVLLVAVVVQVGLVARDRVIVVHATRAAARAVAVHPDEATAERAVRDVVGGDRRFDVIVEGRPVEGALMTVTVTARASGVPFVGRLVAGVELRERLAVRVEGR